LEGEPKTGATCAPGRRPESKNEAYSIAFCKVMDTVKIVAVTPATPVASWQNK